MADFVGSAAERDEAENAVVFAEYDYDEDDDDSDDAFNNTQNQRATEREEEEEEAWQRSESRRRNKAKTTTSYYAERRELALRQLKEMEPKTMVIGALSLACCVKLMQTVSQRLFGVNQPGRGLKHRCNRCAKKDARVKCTRCKKAWYCSKECLKAAWKLEICECC